MNGRNSALQMILIIFVIYLALTGNGEPANLVAGLVIGIGISLLIRPKNLSIAWRTLPLALWSFLRYLAILVLDLAQSGFQVGRILLNPRLPINPGISTIDTDCQTELSSALSAHAITLTPGELVVEMDDRGKLYVHCLNVEQTAQYAAKAQQMRQDLLSKIFR
jgi:multicomponent Na+:H+ antiporter subunit E